MHVGLVSTAATPVRPTGAGSVETLVYVLARELLEHSHEVTVFATAGSIVEGAEVVHTLPGPYGFGGSPADWHMCEWLNLCQAVEQSGRFDVLHSHAYLMGLPLTGLSGCPMVHTTHVQPFEPDAQLWHQRPHAIVTAISEAQWRGFPQLRPAAVIPNGVDARSHSFRGTPEDYVLFLGRFTPGKAPLDAISTARALNLPLVLAGPESEYFRRHVAPLVDGSAVRYVGPVGGSARDALYGGARALLYPVRDAEPFGLVMVEAMMSGTPVAAYAVGAVAEIVEDEVTGAVVEPGDGLVSGVERCLGLDRRTVSERARDRFSSGQMAERYLELYERVRA